MTEQLDEGPVILQDVFHINVGVDSLDDVKQKGLDLEARTLSKSVQLFLDEELVVVEGKVIFKPGISRFFSTGGIIRMSRAPRTMAEARRTTFRMFAPGWQPLMRQVGLDADAPLQSPRYPRLAKAAGS